jgi:hypothetical protein
MWSAMNMLLEIDGMIKMERARLKLAKAEMEDGQLDAARHNVCMAIDNLWEVRKAIDIELERKRKKQKKSKKNGRKNREARS